ncbi:hypothetical protein ACJX0J_030820 [Zea mays]
MFFCYGFPKSFVVYGMKSLVALCTAAAGTLDAASLSDTDNLNKLIQSLTFIVYNKPYSCFILRMKAIQHVEVISAATHAKNSQDNKRSNLGMYCLRHWLESTVPKNIGINKTCQIALKVKINLKFEYPASYCM